MGPIERKDKKKPRRLKAVKIKFVHCIHCQGMYLSKELLHMPLQPKNDLDKEHGKTKKLKYFGYQHMSSGM